MLHSTQRSLTIGALYSLVGISAGFHVYLTTGSGHRFFPIFAGVAAFLSAGFLWQLAVERKQHHSALNGVMVGALSGVVSHVVCWYLHIIVVNIGGYFINASPSLAEIPMELLTGVAGAMGLTFFSLMLYGVYTVCAGAVIGGLFSWRVEKNLHHKLDKELDL